IFTESNKPYEVEIVVAELGETAAGDQMYRITFDGSVADEHGYVAMGGQAEQVAAVLKDRYAPGLSVEAGRGAAAAALPSQGSGGRSETSGSQLEVAALRGGRAPRASRGIPGARLEELLARATAGPGKDAAAPADGSAAGNGSAG